MGYRRCEAIGGEQGRKGDWERPLFMLFAHCREEESRWMNVYPRLRPIVEEGLCQRCESRNDLSTRDAAAEAGLENVDCK
jgi:hypothetical protein